jgi:hypothetical protein
MTFSTRYWQKRELLLIIHESSFLPNSYQSFPSDVEVNKEPRSGQSTR